MKYTYLSLALTLFLFTACQRTTVVPLPPATYHAIKSKKASPFDTTNRETLEKINADFLSDPEYYEIPPGTKLDISDLDIVSGNPRGGRRYTGVAHTEYETQVSYDSKGNRQTSFRVKKITIEVSNERLDPSKSTAWAYKSTLAHELAHAYLATAYPLFFSKERGKTVIEGHAQISQLRWLTRNVPGMTEEKFLCGRSSDYRTAYLQFKKKYIRDGHIDWDLFEKKEKRLQKRL